jgi:hypothetical protein
MTRQFGACPYAATVEQHKSGWPHLNVMLVGTPELLESIDSGDAYARWLIGPAVRAGWGWRLTIERARDADAVAGYLVKLARTAGELTKSSQLPLDAPRGTRRVRSSRGFLGPLREKSVWTGALVREPVDLGRQFGVSFYPHLIIGGCDERDAASYEKDYETVGVRAPGADGGRLRPLATFPTAHVHGSRERGGAMGTLRVAGPPR